jgi:lipopolysaccharide transport system ATP-binding protein
MKQLAIKAENISKQYRLGEVGTGTLSHDLNRFWHKLRGNEDPYLKIGESNDRSSKGTSEYVWSLQDINFEIEKGDAMGIIGRNGAGKSTLLKLLSKVTKPTTGNFKINGRIASLLEVGTGFNPEMTGRENIYLNGAILGMRRHEITRKLAEIIDFSGVERYIDTPVKRYSSGMYVRLAFAVAAHLESEILIVDEVLAVGDAEFQKKCLGKMGDVSKGEGRTVLFVSHNMSAVKTLCNKGIILDKGGIVYNSDSASAIDYYFSLNSTNELKNVYKKEKIAGKDIQLIEASLCNQLKQPIEIFDISEDIILNFTINCETIIPNLYGYMVVKNTQEETFIESDTNDFLPNVLNNLTLGENKFSLRINKNILPHGDYIVYLSFASSYSNNFDVEIPGDIVAFSVTDHTTQRGNARNSYTSYLLNWNRQNA